MNLNDIISEKEQFGSVKTYEVKDIEGFDKAMDELADLDDSDAELQKRHDVKTKPWDDWLEEEKNKNQKRRDFLQREAYAYVLDHNDDHSLKSARGGVSVTHRPATLKVSDQATLVEFAKENGLEDSVKTVETVKSNELKEALGLKAVGDKAVDRNGQVVPGYEVTPAHRVVSFTKPKAEAE